MSDAWYSSKIAPERDPDDGCHAEQAHTLKAYNQQTITATEAAQLLTSPVITASDPKGELCQLYGLLQDALVELPAHYTEPLLLLIRAVEDLPSPAFTPAQQIVRPEISRKLWKGLSGFANIWADVSHRSGSWKLDADVTTGAARDALRAGHVRKAGIEARLVMADLAEIPMGWGYEVVVDALEGEDVLLDFEVPAAAEWFELFAERFREGAERGEKNYVLEEGMSMARWEVWRRRLRELEGVGGVIGRAAGKARRAIHRADGGKS
jgi:hypothetical protein